MFTDSPIIQGTDGAGKMSKSLGNVIEIFADEDDHPEAGHGHGHGHAAHCGGPTRAGPRCATCASCTASSARTTTSTIWEGERTARTGCVDTKRLLADRMLAAFAEARERRAELESRPGYVEEILRAGAERLAPMAAETIRECHERMGLGPR